MRASVAWSAWLQRLNMPRVLVSRCVLGMLWCQCASSHVALAQEVVLSRGWRASPNAAIKIHAPSGTLLVEGWSRDSVALDATLGAGESLFGGGTVNGLKLGVEGTLTTGRSKIRVRVPSASRLVIRSGAADVTVFGLTSTLDVGSAAGNVDISGKTDAITAESISGSVRIAVSAPVVRARTTTGRLDISGAIQEAQLTSVSGAVTLSTQPLGTARIETIDGPVRIRGGIAKTGAIDVQTFGGAVDLQFPPHQRMALDLRATEGTIDGVVQVNGRGGVLLQLKTVALTTGRTVSLARTLGPGTGPAAPVTVRTMRGRITVRTMPQ